jgi:pyruvate,water dikinase
VARAIVHLKRLARRAYALLLLFFEVIGLLPTQRRDVDAQLARFRLYHTEFRKLLSANDSFLSTLADLEGKQLAHEFFDSASVRRAVIRAVADVHRMVESLVAISGDRWLALRDAFQRVIRPLAGVVDERPEDSAEALVLELDATSSADVDQVGGKMAHLGEVRRAGPFATPDGFSATTAAWRLIAEENGLRGAIFDAYAGWTATQDAASISEALRPRVREVRVPQRVATEIFAAYDWLARRVGGAPRMAVRSSALGEDGRHSFAGQYLTVLNVPRERLLDAYREVLASLFSPEAITYRQLHRLPGDLAEMAVGFVVMVDARAAGVAYSRDPNRADADEVLVQAVHGLGVAVADGSVSPEEIRVARPPRAPEVRRVEARQGVQVVCDGGAGVQERAIEHAATCLDDAEAALLARWALALEERFACPQDVEWAVGPDRRLFILQSRPLRLSARAVAPREPVPGAPLLLRGGDVAFPGVGVGPAVRLDEDGDFDAFPDGAVLVARRSSPRFVRLMARVRAIVTDAGSVTGHMASLAREFRVPTLLNARDATTAIAPGALVTVDATGGFVYAGEVHVPGADEAASEVVAGSQGLRQSPAFKLLEDVLRWVAPLHLTDPRSSTFAPEGCETLHDLARFIHEKSYEEMFRLGGTLGDFRSASRALDVFLPIDLYLVDLGGGLRDGHASRKVKPAQVTSAPLAALLRGMLDKRLPRFGARPIDARGLADMMMRHLLTNPEADRTFRDPCYALVSDTYLNYTARVGYHFSVVDAYCSDNRNRNYVTLHFDGGAADPVRRARRARALAGILRQSGFGVEVEGDRVNARISKTTRAGTEHHLEIVGRLLQFFRQMDAAMVSEEWVRRVQDAFLAGDYSVLQPGAAVREKRP